MLRAMAKKKISEEERALFRDAVSGTRRLTQENRVSHPKKRPPPRPLQREQDEQQVLVDMLSEPADMADLETGEELFFSRLGLQHKTLRKLRRGEFSIEAELDLHGQTKIEAPQATVQFLHYCRDQGLRCVRIIHGKGDGILREVLRTELKTYKEVQSCYDEHADRGGAGITVVEMR